MLTHHAVPVHFPYWGCHPIPRVTFTYSLTYCNSSLLGSTGHQTCYNDMDPTRELFSWQLSLSLLHFFVAVIFVCLFWATKAGQVVRQGSESQMWMLSQLRSLPPLKVHLTPSYRICLCLAQCLARSKSSFNASIRSVFSTHYFHWITLLMKILTMALCPAPGPCPLSLSHPLWAQGRCDISFLPPHLLPRDSSGWNNTQLLLHKYRFKFQLPHAAVLALWGFSPALNY